MAAKRDGRIAVVGGGIAGLVTAAELGKRGLQPILFESRLELGGRAQSRSVSGFHFNQGPHALYNAGALNAELIALGLSLPGGEPNLNEGFAVWGGKPYPLPVGLASGAPIPPLDFASTACLAETFARVAKGDYGGRGSPLRAFTADLPRAVGCVIEAFVRLSSYAHAPDDIDCQAALDQLRLSFGGVTYLDGGWRSLVSALANVARVAGADLRCEQAVVRVSRAGRIWHIESVGGRAESFDALVLALSPFEARDLVGGSAILDAAFASAQPLRATCLDLGLSTLESGAAFALGIDAPVYLSLHSTAADLAPPKAGLLHLTRYLAPGESSSASHFDELEQLADRFSPAWRGCVAQKQRLIDIPIVHDYPRWRLAGRRAPVVVKDAPGLFLAGDWVGEEGMLSDAAAASGVVAAEEAAAFVACAPA